MEAKIDIRVVEGKTVVINEFHIPVIENLESLIMVESLGMTADKVEDAKKQIDSIAENHTNMVKLIAFVNVNGMSNLIASQKYNAEVQLLKKLTSAQLKQSILRVYWNVFSEINQLQYKANCPNFYMRKAKKAGIEGDFSMMHFAFDFDSRHMKNDAYIKLKKVIIASKVK
jgi:hypothetical protein